MRTRIIGILIGTLCVVGPVLAGNLTTNGIPEPGTMGLIALGAVGIAFLARKNRK